MKKSIYVGLLVVSTVAYGGEGFLSPMAKEKEEVIELPIQQLCPKIENFGVCGHVTRSHQEKDALLWNFEPKEKKIDFKHIVGNPNLIAQLRHILRKSDGDALSARKEDLDSLIHAAQIAYAHSNGSSTQEYVTSVCELQGMTLRVINQESISLQTLEQPKDPKQCHQDIVFPEAVRHPYNELMKYLNDSDPKDSKSCAARLKEMLKREGNAHRRGTFIVMPHDQVNAFLKQVIETFDDTPSGWQLIHRSRRPKEEQKKHKKVKSLEIVEKEKEEEEE
jgi:hypothetical protein